MQLTDTGPRLDSRIFPRQRTSPGSSRRTRRRRSRVIPSSGLGRQLVDGSLQRIEELYDSLRSEILVVVVVDLDHWRVDTGSQALDLAKSEHTVRGSVSRLDLEVVLDRLHDGVGVAEHAWGGGTHL